MTNRFCVVGFTTVFWRKKRMLAMNRNTAKWIGIGLIVLIAVAVVYRK